MMRYSRIFSLSLLLGCCGLAANERLAVNDRKVPENRQDLEMIQDAVRAGLPGARAATVCIEAKGGSGSGVIVSPDGLVLTAAHVASGVRQKVTVILEDGTRLAGETLGLVADKDAAMVRITDKRIFPFVRLDRAASTQLGDWVFALGHSGGLDQARGSVVRLGRLVRIAHSSFQSDCMVIGGDSGGPLFDLTGKLIAIHSRVGVQKQVNMHVPVSVFIDHWEDLLAAEFIGEGPYAEKPVKGNGFLGLATETRPKGGLRVTKVGHGSPAEEAGVREHDVLLKLNHRALENREQMQDFLKELSAGDEIILEMERGGKAKTFTFNLGAR